MEVIAVALAIGIVLAVLTGGSLTRILDTRVRWMPLAFAALGSQLLLGVWNRADGWSQSLALTLYLGSFLALAAFCVRNVHLTGMSVVLIGVSLNALVVAVNGAMPVRLPADASPGEERAVEQSVTHESEDDADLLSFLGEIILLPGPLARSVSFGDLILGIGLTDVLFHAGRAPRRRRGAGAPSSSTAGAPSVPSAPWSDGSAHPPEHARLERGNDPAVVDAAS